MHRYQSEEAEARGESHMTLATPLLRASASSFSDTTLTRVSLTRVVVKSIVFVRSGFQSQIWQGPVAWLLCKLVNNRLWRLRSPCVNR